MKSLKEMTMGEKARTLFQYFPDTLTNFPYYLQLRVNDFMTNIKEHKMQWKANKNPIQFATWVTYAVEARDITFSHGAEMQKSSLMFASLLFSLPIGFYTLEVLFQYAQELNVDPKLKYAVDLFFKATETESAAGF